MRAIGGRDYIYSEIVRTGTQTRYAPYEVLGFDVRAFRLCANASEPKTAWDAYLVCVPVLTVSL